MATRYPFLGVVISAVFVSACNIKTVEIKERAIFTTDRDPYNPTVICAEPSPDAISAIASELFAKASAPGKGNAEIGGAFRESAAYVGLRTQSIQLLRDSMYRICEAYMNRALSEAQFEILMRRSQKYMIALLAIEQMAGSVQAPAVTLNTSGRADLATSLTEIVNQRDDADKKATTFETEKEALAAELKTAQNDLATAQAELKTKNDAEADESKKVAESDYEPIQTAKKKIGDTQAKLKAKDKELASATSLRNTLNTAIAAAKSSSVGGSTSASVIVIPEQSGPSDDVVMYSTYAIANLVSAVVGTDDMGAVCLAYVTRDRPEREALSTVAITDFSNECTSYFQHRTRIHEHIYAMNKLEEQCLADALSVEDIDDRIRQIQACRSSSQTSQATQASQASTIKGTSPSVASPDVRISPNLDGFYRLPDNFGQTGAGGILSVDPVESSWAGYQ